MTTLTRYPEFEVSGPPRELGRQIGEAMCEQIRGFCASAMEHVNRTVSISSTSAMTAARESLQHAEAYAPEMVEELRGTAEGAGVSLEEIMLLQVRNQLQPDDEGGCTSLAAAGRNARFVAQNWDNDPALDEFTIVLTRKPEGRPTLTTIGQAGLIGYIGFNDRGIGLCLNTLPAPSRRVGVPHYFVVRAILDTGSLEDTTSAVRRAERAIPANVMLITPQGPADLEITVDDVQLLRRIDASPVTHTNHCLHPHLQTINEQFPELIQSHDRIHRIDELLNANGEGVSIEMVKLGLSDHQNYPRSICRHPNDDASHGFWTTVFSVIMEPAERRMFISRGTPCDHPYELYEMQ